MNICRECQSKAIVDSSDRQSIDVIRRYYRCTNVHCGHTFRTTESFDRSISPPAGKNEQLVLGMLLDMPQEQRQELLQKLG